jgi:transposase-like protein
LDWVAIEPHNKSILRIHILAERNMFVAERFLLQGLVNKYVKHPISTDGGTWYPQACRFSKLKHHLHSLYEKSILKTRFSTLRIEQNLLMTIFHVLRKDVNYSCYKLVQSVYRLSQ